MIAVLVQICGLIALIFSAWSYLSNSKSSYFVKQGVANAAFGVQYLLLGAMTGFVTSVVSILKTVLFRREQNKKGHISLGLLIAFEIFYLISGIFGYDGIISLIPVALSLFYTWAAWRPNLKLTCFAGIVSGILWIVYNIHVGAYVSIINSVIEIISSTAGLIKQFRADRVKTVSEIDSDNTVS